MKLSKRQKEALQIIKDHPGIYARGFGELFWPDRPIRNNLIILMEAREENLDGDGLWQVHI